MKKILSVAISLLWIAALGGPVLGHGDKHAKAPSEGGKFSYTQTVDGMTALFIVDKVQKYEAQGLSMSQCDIKVKLTEAAENSAIDDASVALRFTLDHGDFGQAVPLVGPQQDGLFKTSLRLHQGGEQHFLLIVVDNRGEKRDFHFHHNF